MNKRTRARRAALQALYQWQITGQAAADIVVEFDEEERLDKVDRTLFEAILNGVIQESPSLDAAITPCLDRSIEQVDPIERAVLRLATFELGHAPEVPWRVVINEAVDLSRSFGAEQGHRYINGVLDRLARIMRPVETSSLKQT